MDAAFILTTAGFFALTWGFLAPVREGLTP
jgi:hypothetical protein